MRVIESARALGYRQNKLASALTSGRSQVVGVLLPDIENAVFPPIVRGVEERLAAAGYAVLIANAAGTAAERERVLEQMFGRQVDGLVVATASRDDQVVRRCILEHVPGGAGEPRRRPPPGARSRQRRLLFDAAGRRSPGGAWATGASPTSPGRVAWPPATRAGRACRWPPSATASRRCHMVEAAEYTREAGRIACIDLLKRYRSTTAIVAANDLLALGCYDCLAAPACVPAGRVDRRSQRHSAGRHGQSAADDAAHPASRNGPQGRAAAARAHSPRPTPSRCASRSRRNSWCAGPPPRRARPDARRRNRPRRAWASGPVAVIDIAPRSRYQPQSHRSIARRCAPMLRNCATPA